MPFDTSVLDQALADRRAEWERRRLAMLERVMAALDEVAPSFGVQRAYIFGSLAKPGRYHERSDVDVAVEWAGVGDFFDLAAEVSMRLGQDIDILPLDRIHFADKIRREGILWEAATTK
ncbi:MAG: nucleotidyltransferase domain-containing protein [Anaerolineae bacterium]|nr:nucleotidyltransferase domain-containing protein [Anaerolineae bacterium]